MATYDKIAYVNNAPSNASRTPEPIKTHQMNELWLAVRMLVAGDPVGTITVTGSLDGTNFAPLPIAEGAIGGLGTGVTWSSSTPHQISIADTATVISLLFGFDSPPPWVKIAWTRSGGGDADGFYIDAFGRPV